MEANVNFLDTPSKLGVHGADIVQERQYQIEEKTVKQGKHGNVFFVRTPRSGTNLAVKRQQIKSPGNYKDRAYRELQIFKALSLLECSNFVSIVTWYKIRMEDDDEETSDSLSMHYVMECAEKTLADVTKISGKELKEILFQILYALHLAQKELEFCHNDLHLRNILISKINKPITLTMGENSWVLNNYETKICDFGLSRIKVDDEVIFNTVDIFTEFFDATSDGKKLASELSKIKVEWDNPQDKANFSQLKRKMTKGCEPGKLLSHELFQSLILPKLELSETSTLTPLKQEVEKPTKILQEKASRVKKEEKDIAVKLEFEFDKENLGDNTTAVATASMSKLRISSKPRKTSKKI